MKTCIIFLSVMMVIGGYIGKPSKLNEPINTATIVFLFGTLIFTLAILK